MPERPRDYPTGLALQYERARERFYGGFASLLPLRVRFLLLNEAIERANRRAYGILNPLADLTFGSALVFQIDPKSIRYTLPRSIEIFGRRIRPSRWFVCGGEWGALPVESGSVYQTAREIVHLGYGTGDSPWVKSMKRLIDERGAEVKMNGRVFCSPESVEDYYERLKSLHDSIKNRGFESTGTSSNRNSQIGVAVDGSGEVYHFRSGHHRLAIARELGISSIPVKVTTIHNDRISVALRKRKASCHEILRELENVFRSKSKGMTGD